ncbi:MAG: DUF4105 domain-containing protein [Armatimonadetes bacterium]|nr:DUF4105 domain-containing protein [Armatimonadota bacterium]
MSWMPEQRAAILRSQSPEQMHLGNVRWGFDGNLTHFSDAAIDPASLKNVYVVIEPFKPEWLAAHSFLYFEFSRPVLSSDGRSDHGLCVSVEAFLKPGQEFGLISGLMKTFGIVYQVSSWSDVVRKTCRLLRHKLIRYQLYLSEAQKQSLLKFSLDEALRPRDGEYYNTLNNSCFTNVVRQVNSVLPRRQRMAEWAVPRFFHSPFTALPNCAELLLDRHHLLTMSPPVLTQPEPPAPQASHSSLGLVLAGLSTQPFWEQGMAAVGLLTGVLSVDAANEAAVILGGLAGLEVGRTLSDLVVSRTHTIFEPCDQYLD